MPQRCCVPGCKSNYAYYKYRKKSKSSGKLKDGGLGESYVSLFSFPADKELRRKWTSAIQRNGFEPKTGSVVCAVHFLESEVLRVDTAVRPDGSILECPRKWPKLVPDAVPSIFPNHPSLDPTYMSLNPPQKLKKPDTIKQEMLDEDETNLEEWMMQFDEIDSFDNFQTHFKSRNLYDFIFKETDEFIIFLKHDLKDIPKIHCSFKLHRNLKVEIYYNDLLMPPSKFSWILGKENICNMWTTFDSLISHLNHI